MLYIEGGVVFYWKRAIRSLTVPLRGRPLSSETALLSEVMLVVLVMVGVVDFVVGGCAGVEMGRVVGLVTWGVVNLVTV